MSFSMTHSICFSGEPLTGRLRRRADRKRHLAQGPEVTIRVVPRCPDIYYEPPVKIHKAEDRWLNEIGTLLFIKSQLIRHIDETAPDLHYSERNS